MFIKFLTLNNEREKKNLCQLEFTMPILLAQEIKL